ncbi:VOC family protein [Prosthecomicrobium pneumaticum]|uniref:VOC domain-containing protein n=1 Tax=Prosthecomicrobium pneumaticum TaxID=81895 RepID=A0A7W9CT25_9HYPH|nr:VOC family protein [Prosthecomicrobium pneumaticum]MBB5751149.1 hypothetical protein [Prosthecomicrobium pneumaticum]
MNENGLAPRLSLVTLGVADVARARAFYEALGWRAASASTPEVAFFPLAGAVLALFGRNALADDANVSPAGDGFSGFALAHNVESVARVDAVIAHALACGARLVRGPRKTEWGGYSAYFSDPDGHLWEVAHNPFFPLDADGRVVLPETPVEGAA